MRKAIILNGWLIFFALFLSLQAESRSIIDKTGTLSTELKDELQNVQNKLKEAGLVDLGIVILTGGIKRSIINEQILWVDFLGLGEDRDNEALLLVDADKQRVYLYLGDELTGQAVAKNLEIKTQEKAIPWLEQNLLERAIRASLVQIMDGLGGDESLRRYVPKDDKELIQQNPKPQSFGIWIIVVLSILAFIIIALKAYRLGFWSSVLSKSIAPLGKHRSTKTGQV